MTDQDAAAPPRGYRDTIVAAACLVLAGGYYAFWRYHLKRLQTVADGRFYRVAQSTEFGLDYVVRRLGVRTVVSLQLFDSRLHRGWYDHDRPDGAKESEYVASLERTLGTAEAPAFLASIEENADGMRASGRKLFERWLDHVAV